jgi:16S rRNA (cytosine967-C5)-methyltransferase
VLRRMAGDAPSFPWGDPDNDIEALARLHAHPLWLAKLLVAELGWDDAASVMAADNEAAPLYLAHNPFAGTMEEAVAALDEAGADPSGGPVPGSLVVGHPAAAVRSEPVATERVLVSDAAAQLAARLLKPAPDDVVVDIGSGRGTKTLLLQAFAVQSGGPADITAVDDDEFKARILTSRMNRHGVPRVRAVSGDARDLAGIDGVPPDGTAARVLVDAPCSGLGTLRRHPEQRWRVRPDDIGELAQLGSDLLRAAARLCASGGFMVYSTCTLTEAENEGVVRSFLESEGGREFASSSIRDEVPAEWGDFVNSNGFFQSLPSPAGPDGHFAARLQRRT